MCRYAGITGISEALDEAAKQFLLFRKYLYMPEERIMSHVFDFKYGMPTGIPWGRGNGWTLFSLTEVLEALPAAHEARPELVDFFNELCRGYADLQAESGLWHQVLNDPDAYQEASCTAMFAYSFARGVRFGWLKEPQRFIEAALLSVGRSDPYGYRRARVTCMVYAAAQGMRLPLIIIKKTCLPSRMTTTGLAL